MTAETYSVSIAGVRRSLPIVALPSGSRIAFLNMLSDREMVESVSHAMLDVLRINGLSHSIDAVLCPAMKAITLGYELSRLLDVPYVVAYKGERLDVWGGPRASTVAFTGAAATTYGVRDVDATLLASKRVLAVDDVVTTGSTFEVLERLASASAASVVARLAAAKEGDLPLPLEVESIGKLPLL